MDMSKAFDMGEWCKLFRILKDRKVDCLFLRLMLYIYTNQTADLEPKENVSLTLYKKGFDTTLCNCCTYMYVPMIAK